MELPDWIEVMCKRYSFTEFAPDYTALGPLYVQPNIAKMMSQTHACAATTKSATPSLRHSLPSDTRLTVTNPIP